MNGAKTAVVVASCRHASTGRGGLAKRPPRVDNSRETPLRELGRNHTHLFMPESARLITYGMESEEVVNRIMDYWQQYIGKKG